MRHLVEKKRYFNSFADGIWEEYYFPSLIWNCQNKVYRRFQPSDLDVFQTGLLMSHLGSKFEVLERMIYCRMLVCYCMNINFPFSHPRTWRRTKQTVIGSCLHVSQASWLVFGQWKLQSPFQGKSVQLAAIFAKILKLQFLAFISNRSEQSF